MGLTSGDRYAIIITQFYRCRHVSAFFKLFRQVVIRICVSISSHPVFHKLIIFLMFRAVNARKMLKNFHSCNSWQVDNCICVVISSHPQLAGWMQMNILNLVSFDDFNEFRKYFFLILDKPSLNLCRYVVSPTFLQTDWVFF